VKPFGLGSHVLSSRVQPPERLVVGLGLAVPNPNMPGVTIFAKYAFVRVAIGPMTGPGTNLTS
jgi:hypothetical protein